MLKNCFVLSEGVLLINWAVLFNTIFWILARDRFPGISLTCFCVLLLIIPSAPTITCMALVFIFHILAISISRSLYLLSFSNSLAEILLSHDTLVSVNWHVLFCLCLITISGLLACMVLSVLIGKSQRLVTFGLSTTGNGLCSYHLSGVSIL